MQRWVVGGAIPPFVMGCLVMGFDGPADDPALPDAVLEIGYEEGGPEDGEPGTFVPLAPGDLLPIVLGP